MADHKLRQAIALEAARLMYERVESEYFTAKRKAAKRLCRGPTKPEDLPSNAEIRELIQSFARVHEGDKRTAHLRDMRVQAPPICERCSTLTASPSTRAKVASSRSKLKGRASIMRRRSKC